MYQFSMVIVCISPDNVAPRRAHVLRDSCGSIAGVRSPWVGLHDPRKLTVSLQRQSRRPSAKTCRSGERQALPSRGMYSNVLFIALPHSLHTPIIDVAAAVQSGIWGASDVPGGLWDRSGCGDHT